jgi:trehalose utilization protein
MLRMMPIRVTVWHEYRHEKTHPAVAALYPDGMHQAIAAGLRQNDPTGQFQIRTATLDEPEHGLSAAVLDATDVLIWWGHAAHHEVRDEVVARVVARVWAGMGLVALHSAHFSKPFMRLMGTDCALRWREANDKERLWVVDPSHPIAQGLPDYFEIEAEEMYGEFFGVPQPDALVFISWFSGGEVFRSGCCWQRGLGKVFYFRPGHETYPTYHHPLVQQVIANAVRWAAPTPVGRFTRDVTRPSAPLEDLGDVALTKDPSLHGG